MIVSTDNFVRDKYVLADKPVFMSTFAFIQTNMALANVEVKVARAKAANVDKIALTGQEVSALIIHAITYAKKDSELAKIRNLLIDASRDDKKFSPVIKGLPASLTKKLEILPDNMNDVELLKEAFKETYAFEQEKIKAANEIDERLKSLKEIFIHSMKKNAFSLQNENAINYYRNKLFAYISSHFEENLSNSKKKSEIYKDAYAITAYMVHRASHIFVDLAKGKNLSQFLLPDKFEKSEIYASINNAVSIFTKVKEEIDENFNYGRFKEEILNPVLEIYNKENPNELKEALFEYVDKILEEDKEKTQKVLKEIQDLYGNEEEEEEEEDIANEIEF